MIARTLCEQAFLAAVAACEPGRRVADALRRTPLDPSRTIGIAVGKAALAMARGIGPVARGLAVTLADDGIALPAGWRLQLSSHPVPDERSVEAAHAICELMRSATSIDHVVFAISGGASALIEVPRLPLPELTSITSAVMAAGVPIDELNAVRSALSEIKAGQLALDCAAPVITLAASDVIGDSLEVIGSGPTIGPWLVAGVLAAGLKSAVDAARPSIAPLLGAAREPLRAALDLVGSALRDAARIDAGAYADARRTRAVAILERLGIPVPPVLQHAIAARPVLRLGDRAELVIPLGAFAEEVRRGLSAAGVATTSYDQVIAGDVFDVASALANAVGTVVGHGEPTLRVPADHGEGGRSQQLALELARLLRGTDRSAFVAGSDGQDGPAPAHRPPPAGAYVDGSTWDRIAAAGIDPEHALARCDAGTALDAVGALVVTGPTGVNHADVVILG